MIRLLVLLVPALLLAVPKTPILPPESPRVMSLGGAYVAVADDPQCGFLNPAGLPSCAGMGSDQSYAASTSRGVDVITLSYLNPAAESGGGFAMGAWSQSVTRPAENKFYVPYLGMAWQPMGALQLGVVTRAAFRYPRADSLDMTWTAAGDLAALHRGKNLSLGAAAERVVGGEAEMVPRRLRLGGSWRGDSGKLVFAYEWRGDQGLRRYNFLYESSHAGMEVRGGQYTAFRTGYVWSEFHRITFGAAIGQWQRGWIMEFAWSLPTEGGKETIWGIGLNYRLQ